VVTDPVASEPPDGLRAYARRLLPDHMVPATVMALPELPRTSRGKLDLPALPPPGRGAGDATATVAARTPLERELVELAAELLGVTGPVGVTDNFFVLGGHSVTATQLMARIYPAYGIDLPVRTLFDDPTMAGLAAAITAAGAARPAGGDLLDTLTDDDVDDLLAGMDRPGLSRWDG
jgi:hypothetical protein